jgi:hypothetical protein
VVERAGPGAARLWCASFDFCGRALLPLRSADALGLVLAAQTFSYVRLQAAVGLGWEGVVRWLQAAGYRWRSLLNAARRSEELYPSFRL